MKHTERLSVAQVRATWDVVSFLTGMNAGTSTKAAVGRSARRRHIAAMVLFSAVLLSALVLACGAVIWMCQKYV